MSMRPGIFCTVVLAAAAVAGCDRLPGGPGTLVVDLTAVAKATGQDVAMQKKMDDSRAELTAQLQEIAANLEKELNEQREKLGDSPTDAEQQELQQKITAAQQQYSQTQAAAQQQVQQFEAGVVLQYRESLQPILRDIATARGASVVRLADTAILWFDPAVDITAEVIAAVRAQTPEPVIGDEPAQEAAEPELSPTEMEPSPEATE
jgi:Skp family chaperone for outer membrane proteins